MAISVCATLHANVSTTPTSGRRCKYTGQSVRALPIRLITVGKNRSRGVQLIVDDYIGKLKHYCTVDDVQIKSNPKNARDVRAQVDDEDAAVMNLIRSDDWVVMLDEHGLDVGSEQMAELVGDAGNTGASRLSFCIGGPYGHGQQIRERANISIKLSSMVLNHQIALLVLMEQLYRTSDGTIFSKDDIPPLVHLPSLKVFRVNLCFPTDELTTKLFCDLPVLEELFSICDNEEGTLNSFTLSLKRLKLVLDDKIDYQIFIRTPRIKELDIFK